MGNDTAARPDRILKLLNSWDAGRRFMHIAPFCSLQDAVQAARINIALHLKPPFIGNRVAVENLILNYHTGAAAAEKAVCLYLRADLRQVAVHAARIDKYKMASASGFLKGFLCALRNLPRLFRKKGSVYVKK